MTGRTLTVEHDGLAFRCRTDGPGGTAPWIVFANSMLTDLSIWDAQVAALRDRFNILRYDQRGHGGTSVPPGPCDFDQLGGDAVALMDRFAIASATFVGLSMGVTTALHVVRSHPGRIARLVLANGLPATPPGGAKAWQERIDMARAHGMAHVAARTMERWFSEEFRAAGKADKPEAVAAAMPLEGYVACARALQDYDLSAAVPRVSVPTLVLAGADDGAVPAAMERMAGEIAGAQMHLVPGAGHIPNHERPEAFNRLLIDFLERTG